MTYSETYYLLHRLWTKAVGTPGYVKKEWQALEAALLQWSVLWEARRHLGVRDRP